MWRQLSTVVFSLVISGVVWADPGDLSSDRGHGADELQAITIADAGKAAPCSIKGGLCLAAGARTVAVESAPLVAAQGKASPNAPVVPRFARAAAVASGAAEAAPDENAPWALDLTSSLKRSAWAGNALFIFFDLEDPNAIEEHTYTAFYQAPVKAGPKLAAHLALAPSEGFRAGHTYRLRILQLVGGKEILLAEGDVALQ